MSSSPREDNRVPGIVAKSDADNTPVIVEADPATKRLKTTTTVSNVFLPSVYDYVEVTYPTTSSEVFTFKTGGSGGTTVYTVTIVYTDDTKADLSSVTRS